MTDSGQPPKSPPQQPDPLWPPPPEEPDPKQTPAGGPTSSSPSSFDVAATMRPLPTRLDQREADPAATGVCDHARRAPGARLRASPRDRPPGHEAGERADLGRRQRQSR